MLETLKRVGALVDAQNAANPQHHNLAPAFDSPEWHAALELIFHGRRAPNGYTEPSLTKWRRARKAIDAGASNAEAVDEAIMSTGAESGLAAAGDSRHIGGLPRISGLGARA